MRVIKPEPKHVHDVTSLIEKFLEEGMEEYNFGFRIEDCETSFFLWIRNQIMFLLVDGDKVVGILAGLVTPHWFNYDTFIFSECMFYILPDFRGLGAKMLVKETERECKARGITKMALGHTTKTPNLGKFYEALGFKILETHYIKEV